MGRSVVVTSPLWGWRSLELRQLQYLTRIARVGGFRRAADELDMSQATLSEQFQAGLERGERPSGAWSTSINLSICSRPVMLW